MDMEQKVLLYFCEHTAWVDLNSGIQRVTRLTAKAMLDNGVRLVPVKYNHDDDDPELLVISQEEIAHMAKWNGPSADSWGTQEELKLLFDKATALVVPEMITYGHRQVFRNVIDIAHKRNIKVATIVHDVIPLIYPDWYDPESFITFVRELKDSDLIFPVSNSSARDLYELVLKDEPGFSKSSISVASLPTEMPELKKMEKSRGPNNVVNMLFVSNLDKRKNHLFLLRSFKVARDILAQRGIELRLTFVGALSFFKDYGNQIKRLSKDLGVKIVINCSDEELNRKYQESDFTVYPSLYEGFGLPVVESLALGRPVISSTGGSLIEVAKSGCVTFEPGDMDRFVKLIVIMASNKDFRDRLTEDIENREIKTWSEYADQVVQKIYESAGKSASR